MQKSRRPGRTHIDISKAGRGFDSASGSRREIHEYLNSRSGFFYTVKRLLAKKRSQYQEIELVDTEELGKVLLLDGITQVAERWEYRYHELLVHPPLIAHPKPERVLIIGGGDGGALREVLAHRTVVRADLVELDEDVVDFAHEYLGSIHRGAFDDQRTHVVIGDGRAFVEQARAEYDVIVMDMTDPAGPSRFLYTVEFFRAVRRALRGPEAVFAMHGESPLARPAAYACIGQTLSAVFPRVAAASTFVPMYATLWAFRYASESSDPAAIEGGELECRIAERLSSKPLLAKAALWPVIFAADPILAEAALDPRGRVITDAEPDFPDCFNPVSGD